MSESDNPASRVGEGRPARQRADSIHRWTRDEHVPRQTWALAFHRGTMKQTLAPISFTLLQCSAHLRWRSRSRWAELRGLSGCFVCLCRMRGRGVFPGWLLQVGGRHRAETPTMPLMHLGRTDGRIYSSAYEQTVVGRKMDNERVSPPLQ
jgi:hypothetical protein